MNIKMNENGYAHLYIQIGRYIFNKNCSGLVTKHKGDTIIGLEHIHAMIIRMFLV